MHCAVHMHVLLSTVSGLVLVFNTLKCCLYSINMIHTCHVGRYGLVYWVCMQYLFYTSHMYQLGISPEHMVMEVFVIDLLLGLPPALQCSQKEDLTVGSLQSYTVS